MTAYTVAELAGVSGKDFGSHLIPLPNYSTITAKLRHCYSCMGHQRKDMNIGNVRHTVAVSSTRRTTVIFGSLQL